MRAVLKRVVNVLLLSLFLTGVPLDDQRAEAAGSTLLTTESSPCEISNYIVRSNVTTDFTFYAGSADTIGQFFLMRQVGVQAYDNDLWIDIKTQGGSVLGRLTSNSSLHYTSGSYYYTGLSGSVNIPSAGTYSATIGAGPWAANHYFCGSYSQNLSNSGSAANWRAIPAGWGGFPAIRFVSSVDTTAPTLSSSNPANNATGVTTSPTITLNYSENLVTGSGQIELYRGSDSTLVEAISISALTVSANSVSFRPSNRLAYSTSYFVNVTANAFADSAGNSTSAIASNSAIRFTTAQRDTTPPSLTSFSPNAGAVSVSRTTAVSLTFSETVKAGSGSISLYKASDNSLVLASSASSLTFSGTGARWSLGLTLLSSTSYYVLVDNGAITDVSDDSNAFAGVTQSSTIYFTTLVTPDTTPPVVTLSAQATSITTNNPVFLVTGNEVLDCSSISTQNGEDFWFNGVTSITSVAASGSSCVISATSNVAQGSSSVVSITATSSFSVRDSAGNAQTSITGSASISVNIAAPQPTPAPTPAPVPENSYSNWNVSAGINNTVAPGARFKLRVSITCNKPMSLNSSPYYPSMYYMVSSNPWLNGYFSGAPVLSNGNQTATWEVDLTAPASPGSYQMYAYGRGTICFGDSYNFANSSRQTLVVSSNVPTSSASPSTSPSTSATASATTSATSSATTSNRAGYSDWILSIPDEANIVPGKPIQLRVSITCNVEMKYNGAPYYPSMYYIVDSSPRINGVYGRPVLSNGGKTATWVVSVNAPNQTGNFNFQAYGRDNPFGPTCFGDNYNFAYSSKYVMMVGTSNPVTTSPTISASISPVAGYSSWRLRAESSTFETGLPIRFVVSLTCNIEMKSNAAPYFPSMYYITNSSPRINGVYGAPILSSDGKTATWTVLVDAPGAPGTYTFQAYGRDNPTGPTCFGDSFNFAWSGLITFTVNGGTQASPSPTPTPSITATPAAPSPSAAPGPSSTPTNTPEPTGTSNATSTPQPTIITLVPNPNAISFQLGVIQITPDILISAVEEVKKKVNLGANAVVRVKIGNSAWKQIPVTDLATMENIPLQGEPGQEAEMQIEVLPSPEAEPIAIEPLSVAWEGETPVLSNPSATIDPQTIILIAFAVGIVLMVLLGLLRRRKKEQ